ncbi:MAG: ATP-binding cassette domain-containing protein [Gammaproteobacteria bacterium]|nr:ATP-binding cassette domain-containing protein [Gammaproteobacteria bacterium]MBU0787434.1 ATP-binding cassette domain-containing protein [Gammaproteobacteria bacterium]MBU0815096.1 ATP-binding cassette domain-containing protein [Gammaproteobacteria bacterium]MBU1785796.1 ATP-binding cassette domain-containing protein [Gammaproteobacteria bacterium]
MSSSTQAPNSALLGKPLQLVLAVLLLGAGAAMALTLNNYYVYVIANVALLAIVGIGLNVLIGLTGQVSFGHVGFYAIGAYTVAILTSKAGLSFWLAWPLAMVVAGAAGALLGLPALRVKGPYLAMITIAFSFIVEHGIVEMRELTGGQNGIMGIGSPALGAFLQGERGVALLALAMVALVWLAFALLSRGTWGAAMRAVRDSETAAQSVGLNPLAIKVAAFVLSAACAGAAGGLFAPLSGFVTPHTFGFVQSILFVLVVMLGGAGTVGGPVMGAIIVGLLPELLSSMEEYRLLVFGILLLLVLWAAPKGLSGLMQSWLRGLRRSHMTPSPAASTGSTSFALPQRERQSMSAQELSMQFGGLRAVSGLTLQARRAAVTALIGPNGAGKSTVLNMLSGFYKPTEGSFALGTQVLKGKSSLQLARLGVARTYQTSLLFGSLSVLDNVALALNCGRLGPLLGATRLQSAERRAQAGDLLAWCGYKGPVDALASGLAHVDRRLVEIARALALDPEVLLLDEPAAGLSREDKDQLAALLRRIADSGLGVLLVEHDMALVMGISDQVVVLDAGQWLAAGSPAEVQANAAVQQAYLGESLQADEAAPDLARVPASGQEMLGVGALVAGYGAEPVLHGIDLQVRQGEAVALLGANGAGKSTLMRALSGLHRPIVAGGIHLEGMDLAQLGPDAIVARGMVLVPEGRQVFPELSVLDNIRLGAFLNPQDREARVEEMLQRFPRLRERLKQRAGLLSGGEQQMLAVARALMSRPRILLLDEPSLGLAPKVISELFASLNRLRREGLTLLLVDQMAGLALALSDRAYVMENGRIVAQGSSAEIAADASLAKSYLGGH